MKKKQYLRLVGYSADGEIRKVKDGYDVVIKVPFNSKKCAEGCLRELLQVKEA